MTLKEAAISYLRAGLSVLPANLTLKCPALSTWGEFKDALPSEQQVEKWVSRADAICMVCGKVSGHLEMIDFDQQGELFDPWLDSVYSVAPDLLDRLVIEKSQSGGSHVIYRSAEPVCGNTKLAERAVVVPDGSEVTILGKKYKPKKVNGHWEVHLTLIETRGEGGIFLCAPSPGYELKLSRFENLTVLSPSERDLLLCTAYALNEMLPKPEPITVTSSESGSRPGDEFNQRGDIREYLVKHGWAISRSGENEHWTRPGKTRGTSATLKDGVLYVFSSNAAPFDQNKAYSPFSVYTLLEHDGNFKQAASALRAEGYGGTLNSSGDVDLSALLPAAAEAKHSEPCPDPGPVPDELLRVPGFISEVMDHSLKTAPYPNHVMAFCGALTFQAFLAGRKVRDISGNRTNIYLLGLAHSATGKDWPRKLNVRIAHRVGLSRAVAERFASGEGLQDALCSDPCMLFQTDEIDGLFRQVNGAQDARHENIITQLLMMYSSASTVFPMRKLAKTEHAVIDQPCLVLFGTAIPNHYYDALSSRMLTNGLFARMLVLESGPRSKGRDAQELDPPPRVLAIAKWWADFLPGDGNLRDWHPIPVCVDQTEEARKFLAEAREQAEAEYSAAESCNDALGTTVWGRVDEQTRKLALIHAISGDHEDPQIDKASVQWAHALVTHQVKRMLFMARNYVADNPFEAECLKLIRKIREGHGTLAHSTALKNMHMPVETFTKLIQALEQRGQIVTEIIPTSGRPTRSYRITER